MKLVFAIWLVGASLFAATAITDALAGKPWLLAAVTAAFYVAAGFCFYMSGRRPV